MPTLDERVARLKLLFAEADRHAEAWLKTACAIGEQLQAARNEVAEGGWRQWLSTNFDRSVDTANMYMRIARYSQVLPSGVQSLEGALALLAGLPRANHSKMPTAGRFVSIYPAELRQEAVRLHAKGATIRAIADRLEVPRATVGNWLNPERQRRANRRAKRRLNAARKALQREQRDQAARKLGGSISKSWALVHQLSRELERAGQQDEDLERRKALTAAYRALIRVEEQIAAALGKA